MKLDEQQKIIDQLWNFDMSEAPRGQMKTVNGPKGNKVERFEKQGVIVMNGNGFVAKSYWIPESKRWNLFGATTQPIAFIPMPNAPAEFEQVAA